MLSLEDIKQFNPLFLTPSYGGQVTIDYTNAMLHLLQAVNTKGLRCSFKIERGSSLVTRARNEGMIPFLVEPSFTHLFWIDGDVSFTPETALRLLQADKDVIAGAYMVKNIHWPNVLPPMTPKDFMLSHIRYPVNAADGDMAMPLAPDADGLLEVSEAPTGFMCIKRHVFTRMMQEMPELKYTPDMRRDDPRRDWCYRFFDVLVEPETNRYLSEDYAFCNRWRRLGGKVYIDTTAKLSHTGSFVYHGDFGRSLELNPALACGLPPTKEVQPKN